MTALRHVMPWCMMVHFNTRVFAKAAMLTLWQTVSQRQQTETVDDQSVYQAVDDFVRTNR